jgi:hypothetical protein
MEKRGTVSSEHPSNIRVEMLYLDNSSCTRCKSTQEVLLDSIEQLNGISVDPSFLLKVDLIHIDTLEKAIAYRFRSSPTIRVDGQDIQSDIKENECTDCGDLCGENVDCRTWTYKGQVYNVPPKELILEAITNRNGKHGEVVGYEVPDNIRKFFLGKALVLI